MNLGPAFARTVRHFFPDLNAWLDRAPDPRSSATGSERGVQVTVAASGSVVTRRRTGAAGGFPVEYR